MDVKHCSPSLPCLLPPPLLPLMPSLIYTSLSSSIIVCSWPWNPSVPATTVQHGIFLPSSPFNPWPYGHLKYCWTQHSFIYGPIFFLGWHNLYNGVLAPEKLRGLYIIPALKKFTPMYEKRYSNIKQENRIKEKNAIRF